MSIRAMRLEAPGRPLAAADLPDPEPAPDEVLLAVEACGVCRTDVHIADGELVAQRLPLTLGHQIVGRLADGSRVGVPWLHWACGECNYCRSSRENLCLRAEFTGLHRDGGFATHAIAKAAFCLPLPSEPDAATLAPLLCAGLIGHRALRRAGDAARLGLYGFGAAAHLVCQVAAFEGRRVFAFTRAADERGRRFALKLGAEWAGGSDEHPPEPLDAAIIFAPVGDLVPLALRAVAPGGTVVCAGIHMSELPAMPYEALWGERTLTSVANLTRADGVEFLELAGRAGVRTEVTRYPLAAANDALRAIRTGSLEGAAVLEVRP